MDGALMYPDTAATPICARSIPVISVNLVKARAVVITAHPLRMMARTQRRSLPVR